MIFNSKGLSYAMENHTKALFYNGAEADMSRGAAYPTRLHVRPAKTQISMCIRESNPILYCLHKDAFCES